jgi:AcrR family transcriptional regulator
MVAIRRLSTSGGRAIICGHQKTCSSQQGSTSLATMNDKPGLRERKKQATREALRLAALRLAVEKGWEQVRVEDIAAEAGVSPRTFNNYFDSKDEAFLATAYDRGARMHAALAARSADEPLWAAVIEAVVHGFADEAVDLRQARRIRPTPTLAAEQLKAIMVIERALAEGIARRIGVDVEHDLYPRLVAAAVISATRATVEHWLRTESDLPFPPVLRDALERVAAGLPPPAERRP